MQRTTTQPSAATPSAPAAPAGGFLNRPGLMGGLLAGFVGAGLFGLLFGHGLMGGLGGFASILGLLLQVGLVVIVGRLAWNWWQRRNQVAFAGGPALRNPAPPVSGPGAFAGFGGGSAAPASAVTAVPIKIEPADFDAFEQLLGEIQTAYGAGDLGTLRARATPEMLSYFSDDLARNTARGVVNEVSGVKLLQGDLSEAWREGDTDYASVAMRFSAIDRFIDRASGRIVEGSDSPAEATEVWTFLRPRGGGWILSAIQQA
jgi:predicted lipid-binding transport protein (Tim44 family)